MPLSAGSRLFSVVSVRERVCESVHHENLVNTISENQSREFQPILVTDKFGFIDVLVRF